MHSNEAVPVLVCNRPSYLALERPVTVFPSGPGLDKYRQLARIQITRNSSLTYVELTIYNQLFNRRREYERMCLSGSQPTQKRVSQSYFGLKEVSNTMSYFSSINLRLPAENLDALGKIMSTYHPDLCLSHSFFDIASSTSKEQETKSLDCMLFKRFITLHSLRQDTIFMNASSAGDRRAQVHSLHTVKNLPN